MIDDVGRGDRDWFSDRDQGGGPPFPGVVTAAGVMWIGIGSLTVVLNLLTLVMAVAEIGQGGGGKAAGNPAGGVCCGSLIGIAFLACGIQAVKGTAKDTQGASIGSIVFGLLQITAAVAVGVLGAGILNGAGNNNPQPADEDDALIGVITAVIVGVFGTTLVMAGILGLVGRGAYLEWRAAARRAGRRERD